MKKQFFLLIISFFIVNHISGQSLWYSTTGGETIFSFMAFDDPVNDGNVIRFSPVFNSQTLINTDLGQSFGIFTGIAIRNVGFISDDPNDNTIRRKFRTYNVGMPLGLKLGKLNATFIYAGAEAEFAFNFKEKTFVNGDKIEKRDYWFTDRVNQWQPSVFVGFQFIKGTNIKFKYYLNSFFNSDRTDVYATEYERFDGNVFYFSLNSSLFRNTKFIYTD